MVSIEDQLRLSSVKLTQLREDNGKVGGVKVINLGEGVSSVRIMSCREAGCGGNVVNLKDGTTCCSCTLAKFKLIYGYEYPGVKK